jgi:hypothetical protein
MRRSILLTVAVLVGGLLPSSCGGDSGSEDGEFGVTSEVVSHETTKDMLVFAPDAEGRWPVIVAFHGVGGTGRAEIATRLAREGTGIRPTYGTASPPKGRPGGGRCRCGSLGSRHRGRVRGDLDQPVTFLGWSLGQHGLGSV